MNEPLQPSHLYCEAPLRMAEAKRLALALGLQLTEKPIEPPCLVLNPHRLELHMEKGVGPLYADFAAGRVGHRYRFGGGRGQAIARAVGLKGGANPSVIDATAGLGRDAFVLASLGCVVRLMERNPIIAALLRDGLERAAQAPELADWVGQRMQLLSGDTLNLLSQETARQRADVIYLDPMYPHRSKNALVKKEMRIIRHLVGDDPDAAELLQQALSCAARRVVVKRPKQAAPLQGPKPSLAIESKQTRYDVYLTAAG